MRDRRERERERDEMWREEKRNGRGKEYVNTCIVVYE